MKLLEYFFGSRSDRDLLQEARSINKQGKLTKRQANAISEAALISRRQFIRGAGFLGLVALAGGGAILLNQGREERADMLTDKPEIFARREGGFGNSYDVSAVSKPGIDEGYIASLFDELSEDGGANPNKKLKAVLDNASIVAPKDGSGFGSALRICESGYFITVAHNFFELNENGMTTDLSYNGGYEIFNPSTRLYSTVRSVLLAANEDLAIAYAPTTFPRKAVEGLKLNFNPPPRGQRLWNVAITPDQGALLLGIVSGRVGQNSRELSSRTGDFRSHSIFVEGLKPYGGSSGCATVNGLGEVVAIEQGTDYGSAENERKNYTAAEVGLLSPLRGKLHAYIFPNATS